MAGTLKVPLILPEAQGNYVYLFKPTKFGEDGKEQYSMVLMWPKGKATDAALKPLRDAFQAVQKDAFPKLKQPLPSPLKDGDKEAPESLAEDAKGHWFMRVASTRQPGVVDRQVQAIIDPSQAYSGCHFRADVTVFAWTYGTKNGVSAGLSNVQVTRKGVRKGGGWPAEKAFDALPEAPEAEDDIL
jgi:hypothetical protein